jgi:Integrase core domain/Chromo (CHRromatin Organisation MOdifier) domain
MDVLGPLPTSQRGHKYILVISDRFSKLTVAVPMADQTASTVAHVFIDRWVACFGIPMVLLTDNGRNFASKFMAVVTRMFGIKHVYTSAYRPSTNGQVERFNATLADSLTILSTSEKDWDQAVGIACHAYNGSVHARIGYAPFELACTREPAVAAWTTEPTFAKPERGARPVFRHKLLERVQRLAAAAKETNSTRLSRYKFLYDAKVRQRGAVSPGDSVLVKTFMLEPGRSPKLAFPVAGPYPVVQLDGVTVVIRTSDGDQRVHLDRVIRCPMDLPPGVEFAPDHPPRPSRQTIVANELADIEYVIDRLVGHCFNENGDGFLIQVRWAGYDKGSDTWEPAEALPSSMLRAYERKKKLAPGILSRVPTTQKQAPNES